MGKYHLYPEERIAHLKSCVTSAMTIKDYAKLHGLGYSTIQRWFRDHKIPSDVESEETNHQVLHRHQQPAQEGSGQDGLTQQSPGQSPKQQNQLSPEPVSFLDITPRDNQLKSPTKILREKIPKGIPSRSELALTPLFPEKSKTNSQKSDLLQTSLTSPMPSLQRQLDVSLPNGLIVRLSDSSLMDCITVIKALT